MFEYKAYFDDYLNSDVYKDRLRNTGYDDPDKVVSDRLDKLKNIEGLKSIDSRVAEALPEGNIEIGRRMYSDDSRHAVIPHEISHILNGGDNFIDQRSRMSDIERDMLMNLNRAMDYSHHHRDAGETKSDIDAFRYLI